MSFAQGLPPEPAVLPGHSAGCVRGQLHAFLSSSKNGLIDPGAKPSYVNSGTLVSFPMSIFRGSAIFRVLSARNGVLAREIEPSE